MARILPILLLSCLLLPSPPLRAEEPARETKPVQGKEDGAHRKAVSVPGSGDGAQDPFAAVAALLRAEDYAGALVAIRPEIEGEAFAARPQSERQRLHHATGWVAARAGDLDYAAVQFRASIASGSTNVDDWYWLTLVEMDRQDHEAAAGAMAALARRWPERMDVYTIPQVWLVFGNARAGGDAERELLEALFASGWDLPQLGGAGEVWHRLALRRLADGDREGARAAVARLATPRQWVQVRIDRRFDDLVDRDDPRLDIAATAAKHANELRLQALLAPGRLDVLLAQLGALIEAGEFEEALAIADDALARIEAAGPDYPPFEDMDYVGALGNLRMVALLYLGRTGEATAQLVASSQAREFGEENVSQVLNLSLHYSQRGLTAEAREALVRVGDQLSPYGRLVQAQARLRVALAEGDRKAAATALDYLREHQARNPGSYLDALVIAGDLDQAARLVISQLDDEVTLADALLYLQTLKRPPVLSGDTEALAHWETLRARDDVRTAALRVGRLESHPLHLD